MRSGELIGGKYRLEERIGGGGYGDVWRAAGQAGGVELGEVAIKEFREEPNRTELELLLRLSHPNVIALRGVEEYDGRLCLVMEYAEGGSAEDLRQAFPGGVPVEQARRIVQDIASGLAYLHANGIVHRDVKPGNVVFSEGGAKLCDMGLARVMEQSAVRHTGHGTVAYAAPELFDANPTATAAVDLYALGILAYELLTGRLPFGATQTSIIRGTLDTKPVQLPATLPSDLAGILAGCLSKRPDARLSAAEVVARLAGSGTSDASPPPHPGASSPTEKKLDLRPLFEGLELVRSALARHHERRAAARNALAQQSSLTARERAILGGLTFRHIPAGSFLMGSPGDEPGRSDDEIQHAVSLTRAFWMKETPVTQAEYLQVIGANPARHAGDLARPVERVTWFDAVAFANALSRAEGLPACYEVNAGMVRFAGLDCPGYRLPTEAEWEHACRAGTREARYGDLGFVAWSDANSKGRTQAVGQMVPNPWGLHDMLGNVWEWCHDAYGPYPGRRVVDPEGPALVPFNVFRGGSFDCASKHVRAARRGVSMGGFYQNEGLGFRVVRIAT